MQIDSLSKNGKSHHIVSVEFARPFTVGFDAIVDGEPISITRYYVRVDIVGVDQISTVQLYEELDKAVEVSKETYDEVLKAKRTWCEQEVLAGRISPFSITPGMVNPKEN